MELNFKSNSNFLAKGDFTTHGKNLKITNVDQEMVLDEEKYVVYFHGVDKGLVLNITNGRAIQALVGSNKSEDWIGQDVNVYFDPTVGYAGQITGGLRVRMIQNPMQPDPDDDINF